MKAKAGSGRPIHSNPLQSLQSELFSLIKQNISFDSEIRYKNSWDWRDWSALESVGDADRLATHDLRMYSRNWSVSSQCLSAWRQLVDTNQKSGYICICGHPTVAHNAGRLCGVSPYVCACIRPRSVLWVSDVLYFFRATKGPHEGHALVLGLGSLLKSGGSAQYQIAWRCEYQGCEGNVLVNPARFRNSKDLALGMPVHDLNKLICEPCLFRKLNGGYVSE